MESIKGLGPTNSINTITYDKRENGIFGKDNWTQNETICLLDYSDYIDWNDFSK